MPIALIQHLCEPHKKTSALTSDNCFCPTRMSSGRQLKQLRCPCPVPALALSLPLTPSLPFTYVNRKKSVARLYSSFRFPVPGIQEVSLIRRCDRERLTKVYST